MSSDIDEEDHQGMQRGHPLQDDDLPLHQQMVDDQNDLDGDDDEEVDDDENGDMGADLDQQLVHEQD